MNINVSLIKIGHFGFIAKKREAEESEYKTLDGGSIVLNDGAYGMERQEYSMELLPVKEWEIDDRVWMMKRMSFDVLDRQKHYKRIKYNDRRTA